jgi:hypothetical protein
MFGFLQKLGIKSTFGATLKAVRRTSRSAQLVIAIDVQSALKRISREVEGKSAAESTRILREELQLAVAQRQRVNATGNKDEGNPAYARAALLESAITAICSGDEDLANSVVGDLNRWFDELGLL